MFIHGKNYDGLGTGSAYHGQIYVPDWDDPEKPVRMERLGEGYDNRSIMERIWYFRRNTALLYSI